MNGPRIWEHVKPPWSGCASCALRRPIRMPSVPTWQSIRSCRGGALPKWQREPSMTYKNNRLGQMRRYAEPPLHDPTDAIGPGRPPQ